MNEKDKNVLVTGGAGFIGSHLVEALVEKGYFVRVLDNLGRGNVKYIQPLIDKGKIEFIDGDVRYSDAVDKSMKDIDYVFHEAAVCINRSLVYPKESIDINLNGSHNVFKAALDNDVKKVIFASSASVYGEPQILPMSEDHPLNPITPYCVSKIASEHLLKFFARQGLKYFVLRYFNIYGLRQNIDAYYTSVIILFVKRLLNNRPPLIDGDGSQSMDFVNVKDVVRANLLAMESDVVNEVVNVGSGKSTSIAELAQVLIKSVGADVKPIFNPRESVLVTHRRADVTKAKKLLGFEAMVNIEEGLNEVAHDIAKNPELY
jgi:UDP-glucose 4-epimerase